MRIKENVLNWVDTEGYGNTIPVFGGALSGGLTYAMFKPCRLKPRKNFMSYNLCNPDYYNIVDVNEIDEDKDKYMVKYENTVLEFKEKLN